MENIATHGLSLVISCVDLKKEVDNVKTITESNNLVLSEVPKMNGLSNGQLSRIVQLMKLIDQNVSSMQTENVSLRTENAQLRTSIADLERQINEMKQNNNLI